MKKKNVSSTGVLRLLMEILTFRSVKVSHRLIFAFGLLTVIICVSSGVAYYLARKTGDLTQQMLNHDVPSGLLTARVLRDAEHLNASVYRFVSDNSDTHSVMLEGSIDGSEAGMNRLSRLKLDRESAGVVRESQESIHGTRKMYANLLKAVETRGMHADSGLHGKLNQTVNQLKTLIDRQGIPELNLILVGSREHEKEFMVWYNPELLEKIATNIAEFDATAEMYALPDDFREETMHLWSVYETQVSQLGELNRTIQASAEQFLELTDSLEQEIETIVNRSSGNLERSSVETMAALAASQKLLITFPIVAVLISLVISILVTRSIQSPLKRLKQISEREGDLSVKLALESKCEFGDFSRALDRFIQNTRDTVFNINSESKTLHQQAAGMMELSDDLSLNSEQISRNSSDSLGLTKALSDTLASISIVSEQTSQNIQRITSGVGEFTSSLEVVSQNCSRGFEIVQEAGKVVEQATGAASKLDDSARNVSAVVDTIQKISGQINLLALNATIEAASAGEAGRGFSVVANEVKALAKQTDEFTQQIRSQIEEMQLNSEMVVSMINTMQTMIGEVHHVTESISRSVDEQTENIGRLSDNMLESSSSTDTITRDIVKASQHSEQIFGNLEGLHLTLEKSATSLKLSNENAKLLAEMSNRLNGFVSYFKLEVQPNQTM